MDSDSRIEPGVDREDLAAALALYIHVPFCAARCPYCDFNTYAGMDDFFAPYVSALAQEIRQAGERRGRPAARTIFIGGGTPTVLPPVLLEQILAACRAAFAVSGDVEITVEGNPGSADQARFAALRRAGVNRLSLGVQSLDDAELRWLGRIHTAAEAEQAFAAARAAGFANINLDFIFGLPGQQPAVWRHTLRRALALGPEHLSLYSLTVEPDTPLGERVRLGLEAAPDEDLAADLYLAACDLLGQHGYVHYEISNWARAASWSPQPAHHPQTAVGRRPSASGAQAPLSGMECQHNLVYWRNEPYLGFGAGAHSCEGRRRWWNVRSVREYILRLSAGRSPEAGGETIGERLAMGETMMLGLRLLEEGVSEERFRARFGVGLEETFGAEIAGLCGRGLLERLPDRVRLTRRGMLLGNQAFAAFLP